MTISFECEYCREAGFDDSDMVTFTGKRVEEDCLDSPTIEQMIHILKKLGWVPKTSTIWASPSGKLFRGPAYAFSIAIEH